MIIMSYSTRIIHLSDFKFALGIKVIFITYLVSLHTNSGKSVKVLRNLIIRFIVLNMNLRY